MLAQMGITQWTLRQPQRLKGELSVQILASARLLIITDEQADLTCDLLSDIFRSLNITADDVYCITPDNVQSILAQTNCLCWLPERKLNCRIHCLHYTPPSCRPVSGCTGKTRIMDTNLSL